MTLVIRDPNGLRATCDDWRLGRTRVGFVPTMGALHPGHMSLIDAVRRHGAERVVLSLFVNPLQFGPSEDLSRYPRPFEQDLALCREHGVDVLYAPQPDVMYPIGFQSAVEVGSLTQRFEGQLRPTHFRGVTTVVAKLFNAVGPCVAAFGRKDYQQWRVISRMVLDLDIPVEVLGCPIIREADGLAMSSRNRYLSAQERQRATAIHRGLCAASEAFRGGERDVTRLRAAIQAPIAHAFDSIDYVEIVDADSLASPQGPLLTAPGVALVAARLGTTRLIDNAVLGEDSLS